MSSNENVAAWRQARPPSRAGRFDQISIAFHWLTVVLVGAQLTTGLLLAFEAGNIQSLLVVHRSTGALTWVVVALRVVWRHRFADLPPFPASMPKFQQWAAKLNEYGLYGLLLAQPLTGLAMTLFRGRPFELVFWEVPPLLSPNLAVSLVFGSIHEFGAWLLLAFIGLHSAAALLHGVFLRDGVLQRMLPWTASPDRS